MFFKRIFRKIASQASASTKTKNRNNGFVFATTGLEYTNLARRAARTLRLAMPEAKIDLFTDQEISDPVFNQIHPVDRSGPRPKMCSLLNSRFDKTIYLDADIVVLEDLSDVFDLLEIRPMVGALGVSRRRVEMISYMKGIPHGFPLLNGGFVGIKKCKITKDILTDWDHSFHNSPLRKDQPILRGVLFRHKFIPLVLGQEYNLIKLAILDRWGPHNGAVRCLHVRPLHQAPQLSPKKPISLREFVSPKTYERLVRARQNDQSIKTASPVYDLP
ncbi:hypothetical protein PH5382_01730 [Phaeobacter sp. CECT 5382]|nr:hypothetical protein PH5382_01730 [Phaeobacter sp. CECT 5382]